MGTVAIRRSVFDALAANRRQVVRWMLRRLALGDPALYTAGAVEWYVWDDARLDLEHVAVLGAVSAAFTDIPAGYDPTTKTRTQVEAGVRGFIAARLVLPSAVNYTGSANPYQTTLDANGAPAAVRAAGSVPSGLTPVAVSP